MESPGKAICPLEMKRQKDKKLEKITDKFSLFMFLFQLSFFFVTKSFSSLRLVIKCVMICVLCYL